VVAHAERQDTIRIISARRATRKERTFYEEVSQPVEDDLRPEYDFASMTGGVRGKYAKRLRQESNLVLLDPEIAAAFPTDESVNAALRGVLNTAKAVRQLGGLPNRSLHPPGRKRRG
jgi:hypothetical protein